MFPMICSKGGRGRRRHRVRRCAKRRTEGRWRTRHGIVQRSRGSRFRRGDVRRRERALCLWTPLLFRQRHVRIRSDAMMGLHTPGDRIVRRFFWPWGVSRPLAGDEGKGRSGERGYRSATAAWMRFSPSKVESTTSS